MRLSLLALAGTLLIANSAFAQTGMITSPGGVQVGNGKPILGSYTCAQRVPCEDDGMWSSSQWAQYANSCISQGFGYSTPNGFIDDIVGLDSTNCLTPRPASIPKGMGVQLAAQCCIMPLPNTACVLHCDLVPE